MKDGEYDMSKKELLSKLLASREIEVAVEWWANQLLGLVLHSSGDSTIDVFSWNAASCLDKLDTERIDKFRLALAALIACWCADSWNPDDPIWGSGVRCIGTDYGPDHVLRCALDFAGITGGNLRLPIKTTMWINPGEVKVRPGYHGTQVQLYPEKDSAERMESTTDKPACANCGNTTMELKKG